MACIGFECRMFAHICHGAAVEAREAKKNPSPDSKQALTGKTGSRATYFDGRWEMGKEEKFKSSSLVAGG